VFDLSFHAASRTLIAATHGRSQWKIDLTALPVAVAGPPPAARLSLSAPVPNPSRGEVRLTLELPTASTIDASIYDVMGRLVRTLERGPLPPGPHRLAWDGRDARGRSTPAGVYFARVVTRDAVVTRRLARVE
jgi:hypothetical protein